MGRPQVRVFSTYHPAFLGRNPSSGLSVKSHLEFLDRALDGRDSYDLSPDLVYAVNPSPPSYSISTLSLDIETYGIVEGLPAQTMWHPAKSMIYDGVSRDDLVQTIALSWRDPDGLLCNAVYSKTTGFEQVGAFIRRVLDSSGRLLGQNFIFDLSFLRAGCSSHTVWLRPPLALADLSITNYLHSEVRPERSLKSLAPLFSVSQYEPGFRRYRDCDDPELWRYNVQDSASTLLTEEKLWKEIEEFYGPSSPKLSPFNKDWYSRLLWLVLRMSESGVAMDEGGLVELQSRYDRRIRFLTKYADSKWTMPLQGKGSDRAKRKAISDGLDELTEDPTRALPSLVLTKKTKKVSFCDENRNTLLGLLPRASDAHHRLRIIGRYADCSKMVDSYLLPLLVGKRGKKKKDSRNPTTKIHEGLVYPRWFVVPSQFDDGGAGGTVQSRIVPREPGVQTFPPLIKSRICCRYPGGSLLWYDLSQIELRVAALLSGDPIMLSEYEGGIDRHTETAKLIFSPGITTHHAFKTLYRQAGKTLNFLVLFRGGAKKFQETLLRDIGLYVPLHVCKASIDQMKAKYVRLWTWQDELIAEAKSKGFLELPLIGQSRLYMGGHSSVESAMNEIVNQPVQTTAANIMLDIQMELLRRFDEHGLKSVSPLNVYDAAPIEIYPGEGAVVEGLLRETIPSPPYFVALCQLLGRTVPLACEYSIDDGPKLKC